MNFRIETSFEKSFEMIQRREFEKLYQYDQLYLCRLNDGGLIEVNEAKINFTPTYKYISGSNNYLNDIENLRTPSWTDRVLFCDKNIIRNLHYSNIPTIMYSDHRPVQACFEINIQELKRTNNNNDINNGFYFQGNKNNNFGNPFLNNNWNNTNEGNNNFNMNNNHHNFNNGFNNGFSNNNNNQTNWNGNNNFNMNNHRNNQTNVFNNKRNNQNFNNFQNNNRNNFNKKNQNNNNSNQRTNSSEKNNQNQKQSFDFDKTNRSKTFIIPNKKENKNNDNENNDNENNNDEDDNIDNIMKFFK